MRPQRVRTGLCIALTAAVISGGCSGPRQISEVPATSARVEKLWAATVKPYLDQPLWLDAEAYDACNYLMVPLHAAYETSNDEWLEQFDAHFARYVADGADVRYSSVINELQYAYLGSRYLAMAHQHGRSDLVPPGLRDRILGRVTSMWTTEPSVTWEHAPFQGMRERLYYKLALASPEYSYERAVVDEDLLLFAIAADLASTYESTAAPVPSCLSETLTAARAVFSDQVRWSDGGWLLQPGVWTDHPDYAHAGVDSVTEGTLSKRVEGIGADVSHSHRLPLVLTSLKGASQSQGDRRLYSGLLDGLEVVFFENVLVSPEAGFPAWRTVNFLDGTNGVYRWEYPAQGPGKGYGPYELSGTLNLGWWSLLGTERVRLVYHEQAETYPLSKKVLATYVGPNTTRTRNALVRVPDAYNNGFMELIAWLAAGYGDPDG